MRENMRAANFYVCSSGRKDVTPWRGAYTLWVYQHYSILRSWAKKKAPRRLGAFDKKEESAIRHFGQGPAWLYFLCPLL